MIRSGGGIGGNGKEGLLLEEAARPLCGGAISDSTLQEFPRLYTLYIFAILKSSVGMYLLKCLRITIRTTLNMNRRYLCCLRRK